MWFGRSQLRGQTRLTNFEGRHPSLALLAAVSNLIPFFMTGTQLALADANRQLYWSDYPSVNDTPRLVNRAHLDGTQVEGILSAPESYLWGIALDVANQKMYWSDVTAGSILMSNLDGSQIENVVTGLNGPGSIALDLAGGRMYWSDSNPGAIQRSNLDGTNVETLVTSTHASGAAGIDLDLAAGKVYWIGSGTIRRANLDGSNIELLISGDDLFDLALDVSAGRIYFTQSFGVVPGTGRIWRMALNGTQLALFVAGLDVPYGLGIDLSASKLYWTDVAQSTIERINLNGTGREVVMDCSANYAVRIAIDSDSSRMYWTNFYTGTVQRAGLDGQGYELLVTGGFIGPHNVRLDSIHDKLYWHGDTAIQRSDLDGSNIETVIDCATYIAGMALDPSTSSMFWADGASGTIHRANLDGTMVQDVVVGFNPGCLAVDPTFQKVYWFDFSTDAIHRVNYDGSDVELIIPPEVLFVGDMVVDLDGDRLFWSDLIQNEVRSSNLDGSDVQTVMTGVAAQAIAIDPIEQKLYWGESWPTEAIKRSNLDGSQVEAVITEGITGVTGLAVAPYDVPAVGSVGVVIMLVAISAVGGVIVSARLKRLPS